MTAVNGHDLPVVGTALGPGGALEATVREEGLVRFIGVTGHGTTVAAMHARSLERFAFDSVLPLEPAAASRFQERSSDAEMQEVAERQAMEPLFA